jgi:hypothetical protein
VLIDLSSSVLVSVTFGDTTTGPDESTTTGTLKLTKQ